jgi:hypothetical protein
VQHESRVGRHGGQPVDGGLGLDEIGRTAAAQEPTSTVTAGPRDVMSPDV